MLTAEAVKSVSAKAKAPVAAGLLLRYTWTKRFQRESGPNITRMVLRNGEPVDVPVKTFRIRPNVWLCASRSLPSFSEAPGRWRVECATLLDMARLGMAWRVTLTDESTAWPGDTPAPVGGAAIYVRIS